MRKIDIFVQLFRDCSMLSKVDMSQYLHAVTYVMVNADRLTYSMQSSDIPMEDTLNEFLKFFYSGGPKPRFFVDNGL